MKFYLSLTTEEGVLLDRFRLELPAGMNPEDETVGEDSEGVGEPVSNGDLGFRLGRMMEHALKNGGNRG